MAINALLQLPEHSGNVHDIRALVYAKHGHEFDEVIAAGSTLPKWQEGISKRLAFVADNTGKRKRGEGERQTSVIWKLKPELEKAFAMGEEEFAVAVKEALREKKRRKKDRGMDYVKAFRK